MKYSFLCPRATYTWCERKVLDRLLSDGNRVERGGIDRELPRPESAALEAGRGFPIRMQPWSPDHRAVDDRVRRTRVERGGDVVAVDLHVREQQVRSSTTADVQAHHVVSRCPVHHLVSRTLMRDDQSHDARGRVELLVPMR